MAYTINATSCYLNITDNNVDTFYSFRLSELISYYDDSNYTITDDVRHIQIAIAEVTTINSGAFTTFADLQTFIRNAQIVCDASSGGGGVWGGITGTLSTQTDLQTALDGKVNTIINQGADGTVVTGTTAETVTYAELINSSLITDNLSLDASFKIEKTGSAGTVTLKMYINSTPNLSGSPILVFQSSALATNTRNATAQKYINIKKKDGTGTGTRILPTSNTSLVDMGVSNTTNPVTINPNFTTNKYLVASITLANSGDSAWGVFLKLKP